MRIGLGIDTGGTYTDAVAMDLDTGSVLAKAKSMTTREDLSIGIRGALTGLDCDLVARAGLVALSSTLATNSVVEGKGCRVGLVCIGGDCPTDSKADHSVSVSGSHDLYGEEDVPLDEGAVREFMERIKGRVDGLAVSGFLSVRNPGHELRVREIADEVLGVPVVCGHQLTTSLGFVERTITCVLNSRLIPIVGELIKSVEDVMGDMGIRAPLMISRGDGTVMGVEVAKERPVETILSGPAASLMGAMHLTGVRDAVVMDMGGTTTDIGILRGGLPHLEPEGAVIGGRRTRVMAAQVATTGIGGDSRIVANGGEVEITPMRVMPLCVAAERWPNVASYMSMLRGFDPGHIRVRVNVRNTVYRTEFLRTLRMPSDGDGLCEADVELLELLSSRPYTLTGACMELGRRESEFDIPMLEDRGMLQRIGLTPTDILHAAGMYSRFDSEASVSGVEYMAAMCGMTREEFVDKALTTIRDRLSVELIHAMMSDATGDVEFGRSGEELVRMAVTGGTERVFHCGMRLDCPIVGIGAPAEVYIRWMGDVFGTDVLISPDSDVGNAVGAITSTVSESVEVLIRPMIGSSGDGGRDVLVGHGMKSQRVGGGRYEAFSKMGRFLYGTIDEALEAQEKMARDFVVGEAARSHAEDVCVSVSVDRHRFMESNRSYDMDEAVLSVNATGRPGFVPTAEGRGA